eukprot:274324_1
MATQINQKLKFKQIDDALADYFQGLNVSNYRDNDGVGLFLNYIKTEELDDPELPIENELGDTCDPNDCAYTWMNNDTIFPIPSYAQIPHYEKDAFMFYILQYCYKHNKPPSDRYIQTVLVPKCNGTLNTTFLPPNSTTNNIEIENKDNNGPPMAFTGDFALSESKAEEVEINYSTDTEVEGQLSEDKHITPIQIIRISEEIFKPKYPARAHLNIFTPKELTKEEALKETPKELTRGGAKEEIPKELAKEETPKDLTKEEAL